MLPTISETRSRIIEDSKSGRKRFADELKGKANNSIVKLNWSVSYDRLGHDMIIEATVAVADPKDCLLQVWLKDESLEVGIPEFLPWAISVVEFDALARVQSAHLGLFDSKWTKADTGKSYAALVWGYVQRGSQTVSFADEKGFIYPG